MTHGARPAKIRGVEALPPDQDIIGRLRVGDQAMFARLLDAWSSGLLRAARAYVASHESAEDVVQDTWLAVLRGIDRFEGRSSLRTWVFRIMMNIAKTRGVRDSRTVPLADLAVDDGPTVDPDRFQGSIEAYPGHWRVFPAAWPADVEAQVEHGEVRTRIHAAIGELPDRQRIVITMRDVEGYDAEDVCAVLEISAANQRVLLHRARAAVRGRLEEYFSGL
jgi:RNA polymerase sigma-70 factor, ECF subfamily